MVSKEINNLRCFAPCPRRWKIVTNVHQFAFRHPTSIEMHKLQGRDHQKVYEILHMQSELRRMMESYAMGDEQGGLDETSGIYDVYARYHW